MVFARPRIVKKPLTTVWCLDQDLDNDIRETEKTSSGVNDSSGRRTVIADLDIDNGVDSLEVNGEPLKNETDDIKSNSRTEIPFTEDSENEDEITLENEFQLLDDPYPVDVFEYDFGPDSEEDFSETQTNSIFTPRITVGLAATPRPQTSEKLVQRRNNLVLDHSLTVPPRISSPVSRFPSSRAQGLDPRIGLPSLQFIRVNENQYNNNIIGPQQTSSPADQLILDQNMFQTRFYK